ncbi:hypothetical protein C8A03DRAFT_19458, partial [Achaetomium macrosporum]
PEGRREHAAMSSGAIDSLCIGSSKVAEIEKVLARAMVDGSGPAEGGAEGWEEIDEPIKKSVVLFHSRPGGALLLALYADKHWSREWNIYLITAANQDRQETIHTALKLVKYSDQTQKPSILIVAMSVGGEGVNGMQNASYSISVDLPLSEALKTQVAGRVYRYGQIHESHHYQLVSQHPAERIILARHRKRDAEFQRLLEELGGEVDGDTEGPAAD